VAAALPQQIGWLRNLPPNSETLGIPVDLQPVKALNKDLYVKAGEYGTMPIGARSC
jgi:hypothetical protein